MIVIDPGHGGPDNGTQAGGSDFMEKNLVLTFGLALRDRIEKSGKYRVVMTRDEDTFIALDERVRIARNQSAALFVSIHADALPKGEGDAQGATIYTLSEKASDAKAERLAEAENRSDSIAGVTISEEPAVTDILIDLAQRETRTFSNRFARALMNEMKTHRADAPAPPEVGRLPGAEGARRALGAGRTRLCLEQGRSRPSGIGKLAQPCGRVDVPGNRRVSGQTSGERGIGQLKMTCSSRHRP